MVVDPPPAPIPKDTYESLDRTLQDPNHPMVDAPPAPPAHQASPSSTLKRHHSLPHHQPRSVDNLINAARASGPISSRTRRAQATQGVHQYDTPDEAEELLDEVLTSTRKVMKRLETDPRTLQPSASNVGLTNPYPTPSPSASGNMVVYAEGQEAMAPKPLNLNKKPSGVNKWPTPPYDENDWAASASASIWAAGSRF